MTHENGHESSPAQELVTIGPSKLVVDAGVLMHQRGISALPVMDGEEFIGLITKTDINNAFLKGRVTTPIRDMMTPEDLVVFVTPDIGLERCGEIMREKGFHHLVVKDEGGKVIGIVSALDVMIHHEEKRREKIEEQLNSLSPT